MLRLPIIDLQRAMQAATHPCCGQVQTLTFSFKRKTVLKRGSTESSLNELYNSNSHPGHLLSLHSLSLLSPTPGKLPQH